MPAKLPRACLSHVKKSDQRFKIREIKWENVVITKEEYSA